MDSDSDSDLFVEQAEKVNFEQNWNIEKKSANLRVVQVKSAKERSRVCTPPVNGGATCESQGPAVDECRSNQCPGKRKTNTKHLQLVMLK